MYRAAQITVVLIGSLLLSGRAMRADDAPVPAIRPFLMGFTRWPADLTLEGVLTAQNFAHEHGDIVSVMFIGGIPWPEALDDKPFSQDVQNNMAYQPPAGKKLFLSICPAEHGPQGNGTVLGREGQPAAAGTLVVVCPQQPEVKKAYLNFVLRAVKAMNPAYLAIGVENNVLLSNSAEKWNRIEGTAPRDLRRREETVPCFACVFHDGSAALQETGQRRTGLRPGNTGGGTDAVQRPVRHEHIPAHEL